ncbi:MAG: hypothetical protein ACYCX7_08800, partial [Solirubrobacteraceae bacterium]
MNDIPIILHAPAEGRDAPGSAPRDPHQRRRRMLRSSALGLSACAITGGGLLAAAAPSAFAASSAPTHGKTTCAIAGDECTNAIAYANAHDGGGATVLAVEADTEAHGGAVTHRVFDIRMQTKNGVYVVHVYRNDNAPYSDAIWWQKLAENQHPGGESGSEASSESGSEASGESGSEASGKSRDHSKSSGESRDHSKSSGESRDHSKSSGESRDHSKSSGESASSSGEQAGSIGSDSPQISAEQAATDATQFVVGQSHEVLSVKHNQLKSQGQKDYYQVKLQLGENGQKAGTTNVWVDATSSAGTVTAASGSGLDYRDPNLVSASTAQANAVKAVGGGSAYKTNVNGGKWRWYWVFVRNGSTKYKVGVDAV